MDKFKDLKNSFKNVSHETFLKLEIYQRSLYKWNQKINLVGNIAFEDIWCRHIIDSIQLIKFLPQNIVSIADLGSGAGLPGAVIAMATSHKITLIDKSYKKSAFLRYVSRETRTPYNVCNQNFNELTQKFDIVVSRALMKASNLYQLTYSLLEPQGFILLLKGETAKDEMTELKNKFDVTCEIYPSITNKASMILKIYKGD